MNLPQKRAPITYVERSHFLEDFSHLFNSVFNRSYMNTPYLTIDELADGHLSRFMEDVYNHSRSEQKDTQSSIFETISSSPSNGYCEPRIRKVNFGTTRPIQEVERELPTTQSTLVKSSVNCPEYLEESHLNPTESSSMKLFTNCSACSEHSHLCLIGVAGSVSNEMCSLRMHLKKRGTGFITGRISKTEAEESDFFSADLLCSEATLTTVALGMNRAGILTASVSCSDGRTQRSCYDGWLHHVARIRDERHVDIQIIYPRTVKEFKLTLAESLKDCRIFRQHRQ